MMRPMEVELYCGIIEFPLPCYQIFDINSLPFTVERLYWRNTDTKQVIIILIVKINGYNLKFDIFIHQPQQIFQPSECK